MDKLDLQDVGIASFGVIAGFMALGLRAYLFLLATQVARFSLVFGYGSLVVGSVLFGGFLLSLETFNMAYWFSGFLAYLTAWGIVLFKVCDPIIRRSELLQNG